MDLFEAKFVTSSFHNEILKAGADSQEAAKQALLEQAAADAQYKYFKLILGNTDGHSKE